MSEVYLTTPVRSFVERLSYGEQFAHKHGIGAKPEVSQSRVTTPEKALTASDIVIDTIIVAPSNIEKPQSTLVRGLLLLKNIPMIF